MKKTLLTLAGMLVALTSALMSWAHSPENAQPSSLLWKVEGNGLDAPSYIYGTIHMACQKDFFLGNAVKEAFDQSDKVVMELDMDDSTMFVKMQQMAVNPGGKSIKEELSEEEISLLNAFFTRHYGAGLDQLGILRPFVLMSMLYPKLFPCGEQLASYEQTFVLMSQKANKEIEGLETVEDQFGVFEKIPTSDQVDWLVKYVGDTALTVKMYDEMISAYQSQDIESIYNAFEESPEYAQYQDILLHERNQNWIPQLEQQMQEGSVFVAVGAGHLGSDQGVVALLRDAGYTVTPVLP